MKLTSKDLKYLENLSRITVPKSEEEEYLKKLSGILEYVEQLSKIDTKGVKPTSQVTSLENVLREDIVGESLDQKDVLRNSKHTHKGYFKVTKVIE